MALIQTAKKDAGGYSNTNVVSLTIDVTPGSLLPLAITAGAADTIDYITDNTGNTWNFLANDTDERQTWMYWAEDAVGGSTTITVKFTDGQFPDSVVIVQEWDDVSTSSPLDVYVTDNDGGNYVQNHPSGTSGTTTQNDEIVITFIGTSGSTDPVFGVPSGYGDLQSQDGFDLYTYGAGASKTISSTGTQSATFTTTEYVRGQVILATFKLAGASPIILNLSDTVTATDTIRKSISRRLTEAVGNAEVLRKSISRRLTETSIVTDTVGKSNSRRLTDSVGNSEAISTLRTKVQDLEDTSTVSDTIVKSNARTLTDTVGNTEAISKSTSRELDDSVGATDSISLTGTISKLLTDIVSVADSISKSISKIFTSTITIVEVIYKSISRRFSDSSTVTDDVDMAGSTSINLYDTVSVRDIVDLIWKKAYLLLETGFNLLLETGGKILLEWSILRRKIRPSGRSTNTPGKGSRSNTNTSNAARNIKPEI